MMNPKTRMPADNGYIKMEDLNKALPDHELRTTALKQLSTTTAIMENHHRQIIKDNLPKLVEKTDFDRLMNRCVQNKIITNIMKKNLCSDYPDPKECHRELFIKITKRGPSAFNSLVDILSAEFPPAVNLLCPENAIQSIHDNKILEGYCPKETVDIIKSPTMPLRQSDDYDIYKVYDNDEPLPLEIYAKETQHDPTIVVEKSKTIHHDQLLKTYPMRSKHRGVFLMVNIITFPNSKSERRNGAEIDRENLIYLFRQFGYDVFYYENLRLNQFRQILAQLLTSNYTSRAESFVMAILTHGDMQEGQELIEFHDSAVIKLVEIIECFSNTNCPNLFGKPKIFLFPFCRGNVSDQGTYGNFNRFYVQTDGIARSINSPTISDIIIFYASVPGFKTHRDPDKGSWYIQILCQVWSKYAHNTDLETLEKMVGEETGKIRSNNKLQTSSRVAYGFNNAFYFNPGFYLDGN